MAKFLSLVRKEFLLFLRDIPGLLILFAMPALLILVISFAQENAMRYSIEEKTRVLFLDRSQSELSREIARSILSSGFYELIGEWKGKSLEPGGIDSLVGRGEVELGLILETGDRAVRLLIDPATGDLFRPSRISSLEMIISGAEKRVAAESAMNALLPGTEEMNKLLLSTAMQQMAPVTVSYSLKDRSMIRPTVTQNNVPGYILFAMFLIVIPVAGNMVNEKSIGYRVRMKTLPVSVPVQLIAKILLFVLVCTGQFIVMFLVGWASFPGFTGYLDSGPATFLLMTLVTVSTALAATGFGMLIGSVATTHGQAALFGPLLVVILAAISGAFLPVYLMPEFLQSIGKFSPLNWGIENYITLFYRGATFRLILHNAVYLILFFVTTLFLSVAVTMRRV